MVRTAAVLFALAFAAPAAHAVSDVTAFMGIHEECVEIGDVAFGKDKRWARCEVSRARWASTIGLIDMYQMNYCLGTADGACQEHALSLFANRAYTPTAHLILQRIDPPTTTYDDLQVYTNAAGYFLTLTARSAGGAVSTDYYIWQRERWQPIDSRAWIRDLDKRLPRGLRARDTVRLDIDTMSAHVDLDRGDGGAPAGVARVDLRLAGTRLAVKAVKLQ